MPSVAAALRQHADGYLAEFSTRMPVQHKRVLSLITRCRTGELGHLHYECDSCGREHWVGRSCGNRHCPNCQSDKTQLWLAKRTAQLLPVPYFLVTFTVPGALRMIVRANQRLLPSTVRLRQPDDSRAGVGKAVHWHRPDWILWRCTPGDGTLRSTIRTCTSWFPGEVSARTVRGGKLLRLTFCYRKKPLRSCTAPNSGTQCARQDYWRMLTPSPPKSGSSGGWLMSSRSETVAQRSSTWPRTCIASRSATTASNRSTKPVSRIGSLRPVCSGRSVAPYLATNSSAVFYSTRCRTTFRSCATMASPARTAG